MIEEGEARVNVTYQGRNGELRDPVLYDSSDEDIRRWVTEAVQSGSIAGLPATPGADFTNFIVDRSPPNDVRPYAMILVRPKTAYGNGGAKYRK